MKTRPFLPVCLLLAAGCGSSEPARPVNTGLAALRAPSEDPALAPPPKPEDEADARDSSLAALAQRSAQNLQEALRRQKEPAPERRIEQSEPAVPPPPTPAPASAQPSREFLSASTPPQPGVDAPPARTQIHAADDKTSPQAPSEEQGLRVAKALLCTRVDGYGLYETFPSTRFLAGRTNRVVLYTEVEGFERTPTGSAEWEVRLSQELEIRPDAPNAILSWRRAEEGVVDRSLSKRRDLYLSVVVDLPSTLTVGAYTLKAIVRDKASGGTDEAIIPFSIVADPGLLRGP